MRISLSSPKTDLVGAMVSGGTVYASTDSLYIASPYYQWNQQGYSKMQTQVHQFALADERGKPRYVASGAVDGNILNEFSLSEYNGDLRIATTDWNWNGQQGGNHLFVMRPRGGKPQVTDGPYAEAKEVVGGFFIVEAKDRDEAIRLASLHPAATLGEEAGWGLEVHPIRFFQADPAITPD